MQTKVNHTYEAQRKFSQEDYLFIHLSPCFPPFTKHGGFFMHSLQLTNPILPRTLSANHVSAVKLKTALLCVSAVISSTYNPPPPRLPPALHPVARFYSQESTPPSSPGSFLLHHHHQSQDSMGDFVIYAQLHQLHKYYFIKMGHCWHIVKCVKCL